MPAFLKIENPGVSPEEGFTVFGVSLADTSNRSGLIGQFGSGNKHGIAVLLRQKLLPVVFTGSLRLEFGTRPQTVADSQASKEFARVMVKYGGSDPVTGASRSSTEDLGFVLEYGRQDWTDVALALREFVSNAIDRSIREIGDWSGVKIEIVDEAQVRAKKDFTRVFVPLTPEVLEFYNNLGKWFLHFAEPEALDRAILLKANRNLGERKAAVIYRRGVRVREFESSDLESLFDYNLNDLRIDESRRASDWDCKYACGRALAGADKNILAIYFDRLLNTTNPAWEFSFDTCALQPSSRDDNDEGLRRQHNWQEAFEQVAGENGVLTGEGSADQLQRKGYKPCKAPESVILAAASYGVQTPSKVLSSDELSGRQISEPTPNAQSAVDLVWGWLEKTGMTNDKTKPPVKCFTSILDGGVKLSGYFRDGTVYINSDLTGNGRSITQSLSDRLLKVALEECAHFATNGATDNSRDFQDFAFDLAVKLARSGVIS